jgi:hypothetical protein
VSLSKRPGGWESAPRPLNKAAMRGLYLCTDRE